MTRLLLDTSVLIDFLRQKNKKEESLFIQLIKENHHLFISIVTHTELFSGKRIWENQKLYDDIELLCSGLTILPLNEPISKKAGAIRAMGNTHVIDAIIAATALYHNVKLVTYNTKDFGSIDGLRLYEDHI